MINIDDDIVHTNYVLNHFMSKYDAVYFCTNENISSIFKNIDVKNKKVLSILGSGDQTFYLVKNGVKDIDVFDINKLTFYYFYLRIWTIIYLKSYYPISLENDYIEKVLSFVKVKNHSEEVAYNYWLKYLDTFSSGDIRRIFQGIYYVSKIPNVYNLNRKLKKINFDFYNIDISRRVDINKKYDIIYVSNINEWIDESGRDLCVYRDNLNKLLNDGGLVLCSTFDDKRLILDEVRLFDEYFECRTLHDFKPCSSKYAPSLGYAYVKK